MTNKCFIATFEFSMALTATLAQAQEEAARMLRNNFGEDAKLVSCDEKLLCSKGFSFCPGNTKHKHNHG